jgi:YgiT-type zinc finger domain-containing protein
MCVICKTGQTEDGLANLTFIDHGTTLVIKDVPALVCSTCGEEYVAEDIGRRLMALAREAAARGVEVDVRRFEAA